MTRGWWIVIGAVAGALILTVGVYALSLFTPALTLCFSPGIRCATPALAFGVAGLVLGGFLGSRALGMARPVRAAIGALCGAAIFATVGGFLSLFLGLASPEGAFHGLTNFVIGAIVGGIAGIVLGGLLGGRTPGSNREVS